MPEIELRRKEEEDEKSNKKKIRGGLEFCLLGEGHLFEDITIEESLLEDFTNNLVESIETSNPCSILLIKGSSNSSKDFSIVPVKSIVSCSFYVKEIIEGVDP